MKVLFVESYPHVIMGQQRTLLALLKASKDSDIEPVIACTSEGIYTDKVREEGYSVEIFSYPDTLQVYGGEIYRYGITKKCKTYLQIFSYVLNIKKKLKDLKIDAVYCNDMRGILTVGVAAKLAGIPVITWDKLDKPHGWLDQLQLPLVSKNIIISDAVKVKYPSIQKKVFNNKIVKVYEGVDFDAMNSERSVRSEFGFTKNDIVIAIVGSISARKGHDRILSIFPSLYEKNPNIKLLIVGDTSGSDSEVSYKNNLDNSNHKAVIWAGYRKDVPAIMNSIDILIMPSRYEGMGMVGIEAMASCKPVVGANSGGIPEVVEHGETGFIFEGDDLEGFKRHLLTLCESKALREKMGLAGLKRAQRYFDRTKQHQKVIKLLQEAAN
ncbi:glycosyltransferase family 4 protein [Vibrio sp. 1863]|uniref:glycosyltransferase family 4 protein n=1 Tax=Vibrio sp. 1863 TaxID=3074579 RepID=UPI0029654509|nr:glycosyltransferase family 4 protein [Vibrio sp. 1863]MDW2075368.1 glycosyltransferase family 4 protein [Vibrio sp. 1863]